MPAATLPTILTQTLKNVTFRHDLHKPFNNGTIFTGPEFFKWLNEHTGRLWVMTYTVNDNHGLRPEITRLIYSLGKTKLKPRTHVPGIHTKLYLTVDNRRPVSAFVGSQNLVSPTTENLMVRLEQRFVNDMAEYFDHFWKK